MVSVPAVPDRSRGSLSLSLKMFRQCPDCCLIQVCEHLSPQLWCCSRHNDRSNIHCFRLTLHSVLRRWLAKVLVPETFIVQKLLPHLSWQAGQNLRINSEWIIIGRLLLLLLVSSVFNLFLSPSLPFTLIINDLLLLSWLLLGRWLPIDFAEDSRL